MKVLAWVAALFLLCATAGAETAAPRGSWKGPWYIGMSSGAVVLDIAEDGSGSITLTNLDDFGAAPVPLAKQSFDGTTLSFSATGANGAVLTMNLKLDDARKQMRGNGKHGGFGARMELQRAE